MYVLYFDQGSILFLDQSSPQLLQMHIQTSPIVLCETSNYREQVAWFPIIDLVDIPCPWVATDARDHMNRIEYVVSLGCTLINLHLLT